MRSPEDPSIRRQEWGSSMPPQETLANDVSEDPRERAFQLSQQGDTVLTGNQFLLMLERIGILTVGDRVRRVVIDAEWGGIVTLYVERYGSTRLLDVETQLQGVRIQAIDVSAHDQPGRSVEGPAPR